jgi:Flp pilus assembly pilin Flp
MGTRATLRHELLRLFRDEQGSEVIEYALLLGMIACASIVVVAALGSKVVQRWTHIDQLLRS